MQKISKNTYRLSSGREFDANEGLIAISQDGTGFSIGEGYDGYISGATDDGNPEYSWIDPEDCWTAEERAELADFMIAQWTAFKEIQK
jgi:hypothetical protein